MDTAKKSNEDSVAGEQHSVARSVVLHLLPGALLMAFYVAVAPVIRSFGFPSLMAVFLGILFVLVPFELGYLIYRSRATSSFSEVVLYREPVSRGQFFSLVLSLFVWAALCSMFLYPPLDAFFLNNVFSWFPESLMLFGGFSGYSTAALATTWVFGIVVNGVAGPVVEELYFRGYLLPRISRFGAWAPPINAALFSLYHFFTPWQTVGRIVALLPMVYAVWWRENIYVGIAVHCLGNVATMLLLVPLFL